MAISAYPRTAVQGSTANGNPQNGLSLMLLNSTTGQYEAATSETFAGGGGSGGGDATAANQNIQINKAGNTNTLLTTINNQIPLLATLQEQLNGNNSLNSIVSFLPALDTYLYSIKALIETSNNLLTNIANNQINGAQKVVITDTTGNNAFVDSNAKALRVNVITAP